MELNWTKVDFRNPSGSEAATGDGLRSAHEALARDLSISLSAFLRSSVTATYAGCRDMLFSDVLKTLAPSCYGLALMRPQNFRLLLQVEYSVLFPIVGIALGAKPGSFLSPDRKPTEIELQVVNLLFRLLLSDAYRAWAVPLKSQLETVTLEVEPRPAPDIRGNRPGFRFTFRPVHRGTVRTVFAACANRAFRRRSSPGRCHRSAPAGIRRLSRHHDQNSCCPANVVAWTCGWMGPRCV